MFASHLVPRSYNHYMLSTQCLLGWVRAGFEHGTRHPSPSFLRGGRA